ncbi:hypothetical protein [Clostridium massiliamazoniense]|uniref:hypothetical protein n=1 Tax=Clostridium massiliamazoniense TaxID=1347366 RepID=UPI0006D78687|nr:hypothetical protein [Clostridium massiliamazoniense]
MINDILNRIESENGELELLYSRHDESSYGYVDFSLKTIDHSDVVLRVKEEEMNILKFLLIYRIVSNSDENLFEKMSKLLVLENDNIVNLLYILKKNQIDLDKSIEDILKYRRHDLVSNLLNSLNNVIEQIDTYSLINITVEELDSLCKEEFYIEKFKKARYKVFSYMAEELIESREDGLTKEERALVKSTILSLALRKKENLYYITKEIIREMTSDIKDKIELNSERILEGVKEHKSYRGYELISNYDSDTLILEENSDFYRKVDILLFIIPFLYCEVKEEEEEIEYLELNENEEEHQEDGNQINEEIIVNELRKFRKIIPSAKQMTERYYNRRKDIIDEQFKRILELFNNVDLERAIKVDFIPIEEVRDYLIEEGYLLEEHREENKTTISW